MIARPRQGSLELDLHPAAAARRRTLDAALLLAGLTAMAAGAAGLAWSYSSDLILAYNDAMGHLNIARRVVDSRTPGLTQLGTVWLPVPHLLLLPFTSVDWLWHSGLAGSLLGLLAFTVTAVLLFKAVRLITTHPLAPWLGMLIFVSNPNMLYLQTTALTEPVLLMMLTAGAYYVLKWERTNATLDLTIAGLMAALAVGTRYDGWFFAASAGVVVLLTALWRARRPAAEGTPRAARPLVAGLRPRRLARIESAALTYAAVPLYAMLLWVAYNWIIFGDPLEFQRGRYSAAEQQQAYERSGDLLTKGDLLLSTKTYTWAVIDNLGTVVLGLGVAGLLLYLLSTRLRPGSYGPLTFLGPYFFNILALYLGQSILITANSPTVRIVGFFNIRYGILILPAVALFAAYLGDRLLRRAPVGLVLPLLLAAVLLPWWTVWLPGWPVSVVTVADGTKGQSARAGVPQVARRLRADYDGGGILITDDFIYDPSDVVIQAGIPLREYISVHNGPIFRQALAAPELHAAWVLRYLPDDRTRTTVIDEESFSRHYAQVAEDLPPNFLLFQRRPAPAVVAQAPPSYAPAALPNPQAAASPATNAIPAGAPTAVPTPAVDLATAASAPAAPPSDATPPAPDTAAVAPVGAGAATGSGAEAAPPAGAAAEARAPTAPAAATATPPRAERVDAPIPVNLRDGPGTRFPSLGLLAPGTPLMATGESVAGEGAYWRRFRVDDGRTGWIRAIDVAPADG